VRLQPVVYPLAGQMQPIRMCRTCWGGGGGGGGGGGAAAAGMWTGQGKMGEQMPEGN